MPAMYESIEKEIEVLARKAKANGLWFYHTRFKSWLTPEEFYNQGKSFIITSGQNDRTFIDSYYMSDPKEGIRSRIAYLKKASAELNEFTEKVMTYYNFVAKEKSKAP